MKIDFSASVDLESKRFCRYLTENSIATNQDHEQSRALDTLQSNHNRLTKSEQVKKEKTWSRRKCKRLNSLKQEVDGKEVSKTTDVSKVENLYQRLSCVVMLIMKEKRFSNLNGGRPMNSLPIIQQSDAKFSSIKRWTQGYQRSRSIFQCIFLSILLLSGSYASPVAEKRIQHPINHGLSHLSNKFNKSELSRIHIRSGLTPALGFEKTSPSKRDLSPFISHREPQKLVTKMGYSVEIKNNGKVKGTRRDTPYSVFEFISIQTGIIAIRSKKTRRYLAMDRKGRLVGLASYTKACNFHESLVENNYFVFYQDIIETVGRNRKYRRRVYMGFDKRGKPKRGRKVQRNDSSAHFQKLKAQYPIPGNRRRPRLKKPRKGKRNRSRKMKKA